MRSVPLILLMALLVVACAPASLPLVRDGAGLFSADAEAEAEQRLQVLGEAHGIWVYIVSEVDGDPPRMLEEPMTSANADGLRAIAILMNQSGTIGSGYSMLAADAGDTDGFFSSSAADGMIERGANDAALEVMVDHIEVWVRGEAGEIGS